VKRADRNPAPPGEANDFERAAAGRSAGVLAEFLDFLRYHRKWWLLPILAVLLLAGVVAILGGTAIAPFIYTLF
jgi:hypothetical protein